MSIISCIVNGKQDTMTSHNQNPFMASLQIQNNTVANETVQRTGASRLAIKHRMVF